MSLPVENSRPPNGEYALQVRGAMSVAAPGTLRLLTGSDGTLSGDIDARPIAAANGQDAVLDLGAGSHEVNLLLNLPGRNWRFVPLWNGVDLFAVAATSVAPLTRVGCVGATHRTLADANPDRRPARVVALDRSRAR